MDVYNIMNDLYGMNRKNLYLLYHWLKWNKAGKCENIRLKKNKKNAEFGYDLEHSTNKVDRKRLKKIMGLTVLFCKMGA